MMQRAKAFVALAQETMQEFIEDDGPWLAAAMAYYAAFSFFPLLLVLIAGLGVLLQVSPGAQDAQSTLLTILARTASPALAHELDQVLTGVKTQAGVGGPIGLAGVLLGAIGIMGALDSAFNRLWNIPAPKTNGIVATLRLALWQRVKAFIMLLLLGALLVVVFIGGLVLAAVSTWADTVPAAHIGWQGLQILISIAVNAFVCATIYKYLPRARVHWRDALAGAVLVAVIWEIGKVVLASVIIGQHYSPYGVVGAFIALMAWIFYACTIFFICAEFVQVLCEKRSAAAPDKVERRAGPQQLVKTESRR